MEENLWHKIVKNTDENVICNLI